ncbi:MAG: hypothetical protein IMZ53_05335 [Thermoplasmata archaeon]|nr:hypothetical protein [Thermoplasmata archaeon]
MKKFINKIGMINLIVYSLVVLMVAYVLWSKQAPVKPIEGMLQLEKNLIQQENYVSAITITGCDYIILKMGESASMLHKGDCSNPIHKNKDYQDGNTKSF